MAPRGGVITGVGTAVPEQIVTNADLEKLMDTTDEWIVERTGIKQRHWGDRGPSSLATEACQKAMDAAGVKAADIDLLILATCSPEFLLPGSSAQVQHDLGLKCGAFDLNAACSGFMYSMVAAHGFFNMGMNRILVVGSEQLSRIVDHHDRGTAILFGDGAGAAVIEACEGEGDLLSYDLGVDGSAVKALYTVPGEFTQMDGKEVYRRAIRAIVETANLALEKAKMTIDDIDWVIPHQANRRIIEGAMSRLNWPMEQTSTSLEWYGNTSAASIPLALDHELRQGNVKPGDHVLMCGFGAGMTWASAVLRWGGVTREGSHGPRRAAVPSTQSTAGTEA
jgi:3-oxoacyl-[acyl-carrier-protein] synthase III